MKKAISIILSVVLVFTSVLALSSCSSKNITIAIPNDTTNEARALLLLEDLGYITLKDGAGITATILDIEENPYNIKFNEVEAAQLPNVLPDVDYAIINSNYAISADLDPMNDALDLEGSSSAYGNILAVKEGNENSDIIKALVAALAVCDNIVLMKAGSSMEYLIPFLEKRGLLEKTLVLGNVGMENEYIGPAEAGRTYGYFTTLIIKKGGWL